VKSRVPRESNLVGAHGRAPFLDSCPRFPMKIRGGEGTPGNDSRDWNTLIVTPLKNGVQILPPRKWGSSLVPGFRRNDGYFAPARNFHRWLCHLQHGSSRGQAFTGMAGDCFPRSPFSRGQAFNGFAMTVFGRPQLKGLQFKFCRPRNRIVTNYCYLLTSWLLMMYGDIIVSD